MEPWSLADVYQSCLYPAFYSEDGSSKAFQYSGTSLPNHMVPYPTIYDMIIFCMLYILLTLFNEEYL